MFKGRKQLEILVKTYLIIFFHITHKNHGRLLRSLGFLHGQFQQGSEFNILLVSLHRRLLIIWLEAKYVNHRPVPLFVLCRSLAALSLIKQGITTLGTKRLLCAYST
jgi:hypothetical protein